MSGQFRVIIYSLEIISWDVKGTSQVPLTSHKPMGNFGSLYSELSYTQESFHQYHVTAGSTS